MRMDVLRSPLKTIKKHGIRTRIGIRTISWYKATNHSNLFQIKRLTFQTSQQPHKTMITKLLNLSKPNLLYAGFFSYRTKATWATAHVLRNCGLLKDAISKGFNEARRDAPERRYHIQTPVFTKSTIAFEKHSDHSRDTGMDYFYGKALLEMKSSESSA